MNSQRMLHYFLEKKSKDENNMEVDGGFRGKVVFLHTNQSTNYQSCHYNVKKVLLILSPSRPKAQVRKSLLASVSESRNAKKPIIN